MWYRSKERNDTEYYESKCEGTKLELYVSFQPLKKKDFQKQSCPRLKITTTKCFTKFLD